MGDDRRSREDGWEAHRRDQRRREALATPLQRLRWLEEAIAFAYHSGALPRPVSPTDPMPIEPRR